MQNVTFRSHGKLWTNKVISLNCYLHARCVHAVVAFKSIDRILQWYRPTAIYTVRCTATMTKSLRGAVSTELYRAEDSSSVCVIVASREARV